MPLWRFVAEVPAGTQGAFLAAIEDQATLSVFEAAAGRCEIETWLEAPDEAAALVARLAATAAALGVDAPATRVAPAEDDWLRRNRESFRRLAVGRVVVRPSFDRDPVPATAIALTIDASLAFGTGEHASTRGCLLSMQALARCARRPRRVLDFGCGSAILAMVAARLWPRAPGPAIQAVDIDREALPVARENLRLNGLRARVRVRHGAGGLAGLGRRYDLVLANVLARPLIRLAGALSLALKPGGRLVLAGLLAAQERMVLAAYRARRLTVERRIALDGWSILVLRRPPARRGTAEQHWGGGP